MDEVSGTSSSSCSQPQMAQPLGVVVIVSCIAFSSAALPAHEGRGRVRRGAAGQSRGPHEEERACARNRSRFSAGRWALRRGAQLTPSTPSRGVGGMTLSMPAAGEIPLAEVRGPRSPNEHATSARSRRSVIGPEGRALTSRRALRSLGPIQRRRPLSATARMTPSTVAQTGAFLEDHALREPRPPARRLCALTLHDGIKA
jgi:hypothetical protein